MLLPTVLSLAAACGFQDNHVIPCSASAIWATLLSWDELTLPQYASSQLLSLQLDTAEENTQSWMSAANPITNMAVKHHHETLQTTHLVSQYKLHTKHKEQTASGTTISSVADTTKMQFTYSRIRQPWTHKGADMPSKPLSSSRSFHSAAACCSLFASSLCPGWRSKQILPLLLGVCRGAKEGCKYVQLVSFLHIVKQLILCGASQATQSTK